MTFKPQNPFTYSVDPELCAIYDKLFDLKARVGLEFAKAEKIAGFGENAKFVPLNDAKIELPSYTAQYDPYRIRNGLAAIDKQVTEAITIARAHVAEVELINKPLIEQNQTIYNQVVSIMTRLGIANTYTTYEFPTTRSRTRKSVCHSAGYIGDLTRIMPKSNTGTCKYQIDEFERNYKRWAEEQVKSERNAKIAADIETVNRKIIGDPELVATLMQAGVNIIAEVQKAEAGEKSAVIGYCIAQAIDNLLNRDQYLKTGYYLKLAVMWPGVALEHVTNAWNSIDHDEIKESIKDVINNWSALDRAEIFNNPMFKWSYKSVLSLCEDPVATQLLEMVENLKYQ